MPVLWVNFTLTITYDCCKRVRLGTSDPSSPPILVRNSTAKRRKFAGSFVTLVGSMAEIESDLYSHRAREEYEVSERRACRVVRQWRGTQRYVPLRRTDEDQAILTLQAARAFLGILPDGRVPFSFASAESQSIGASVIWFFGTYRTMLS